MTRPLAILALLCILPIAGCALPDRYSVGYSHELPGANNLPPRDIVSVGVSGPLGRSPDAHSGDTVTTPSTADFPPGKLR